MYTTCRFGCGYYCFTFCSSLGVSLPGKAEPMEAIILENSLIFYITCIECVHHYHYDANAAGSQKEVVTSAAL